MAIGPGSLSPDSRLGTGPRPESDDPQPSRAREGVPRGRLAAERAADVQAVTAPTARGTGRRILGTGPTPAVTSPSAR
ncbi:hypothetical protein AB0D46_31305 [Streptomyces sp. NPDC048383]|uniref:hypothetical protein n=1 Tax=Streptomyces sp. NPDC048383 TaxID=3155386 RepID=UPI0034189B87